MKEKFYWKTSFWIYLYFFVTLIIIALQMAACWVYGSELLSNFLKTHFKFAELINVGLDLPIKEFLTLWVGIVSAYVGIDRAQFTLESSQLESGEANYGDPSKLRKVILLCGILLAATIVGEILKDGSGAEFGVSQAAVAFGTTIMLYVAGQKAISMAKVAGPGDLNNDGVVDEEDEKIAKRYRELHKDQ
jgi:hypothetical protein